MMELQVFKYADGDSFSELTTVGIGDEIWFIAAEVCKVLDLKNPTQVVAGLDEDEHLPYVLHRAGQNRTVNLISESGLYALVFKSNKPSAKQFRKWVTKEVIPAIRKTGSYEVKPNTNVHRFVSRFNANWDKTEKGYFSVISELYVRLHGKFELNGYTLPDLAIDGETELRPDISVGSLFSKYLKTYHPAHKNNFKMYPHTFPNGQIFECRQYPNELLAIFIKFVDDFWLVNHAQKYFKTRDPLALAVLPKVLTV